MVTNNYRWAGALALFLLWSAMALGATHRSKACGVSLQVPRGWIVDADAPQTSDDGKKDCDHFRLLPTAHLAEIRREGEYQLYSVDVRVLGDNFDSAASEAGFEKRTGAWAYDNGLSSEVDAAQEIHSGGWRGLQVSTSTRCYNNQGYTGLCDISVAVVTAGNKSVILVGGPQAEDVFPQVLRSIRLDTK